MLKFRKLFQNPTKCVVIGMIHVEPLPGAPLYRGAGLDEIIEKACSEARIYVKYALDGILVENMHDVPYVNQSKRSNSITTACMTRVCSEIRSIVPTHIPCGVQILATGNKQALAVSKAASLDFIRAEGFVYGHVADEGFTDANAGHILRYRRRIDAENVLIFADIKKKHASHSITQDVSIEDTAKGAEFFLADGLIVTGSATGRPADSDELVRVQGATSLPVLIGSGASSGNLGEFARNCDGVIVGSDFKSGGRWDGGVEEGRVREFMEKRDSLFA